MARERFRLSSALTGLTPDAQRIADEVKGKMRDWIDDNVDELERKSDTRTQKAAQEMQTELTEVESRLRDAGQRMDGLLGEINRLSTRMESGDGQTLEQAITETRRLAESVRDELKAREDQWRGFGKKVADIAISAGSRAVGIPL